MSDRVWIHVFHHPHSGILFGVDPSSHIVVGDGVRLLRSFQLSEKASFAMNLFDEFEGCSEEGAGAYLLLSEIINGLLTEEVPDEYGCFLNIIGLPNGGGIAIDVNQTPGVVPLGLPEAYMIKPVMISPKAKKLYQELDHVVTNYPQGEGLFLLLDEVVKGTLNLQ